MRASRQRERQEVVEKKKRSEAGQRQEQRAIRDTIQDIMTALGETDNSSRNTITRAVNMLGIEWTQALRQEVEQIEAQGGMLVADGTRRRTPGGVYLFLLKQRLNENGQKDIVKQIFSK